MTPETDADLAALVTKLVVESGCAGAPDGAVPNWVLLGATLPAAVAAARDALLAHIEARYVRADRVTYYTYLTHQVEDLERMMRTSRAGSARYTKEELTDGDA